uniref:Uncharacterized protein n=1 Tax=Octopus bimaculoides TaxID=37653 RepID=A0A0L8GP78_OCTBM
MKDKYKKKIHENMIVWIHNPVKPRLSRHILKHVSRMALMMMMIIIIIIILLLLLLWLI